MNGLDKVGMGCLNDILVGLEDIVRADWLGYKGWYLKQTKSTLNVSPCIVFFKTDQEQ
jgi:hypothetical protein